MTVAKYYDAATSTWKPINPGQGGGGTVNSVNGKSPDGSGAVTLVASDLSAVPTSRTVSAGTGLTGGGDLSANRSLAVSYGTAAGTAAQGNDSRITGAVQASAGIVYVNHGSNAATARPTAAVVYWYGTVAPTNAQAGDLGYGWSS